MTANRLEEKLRKLRKLYLSSLNEKLNELGFLFNKLQSNWLNEDCYQLQFNAHSLRGSGGTLGFVELSKILHKIDSLLKPLVGHPPSDKTSAINSLSEYFIELHQAYENLADHAQGPYSEKSTIDTSEESAPNIVPAQQRTRSLSDNEIKIIVVDDDKAVGTLLTKLLLEFNFQVTYCQSLADAKARIASTKPNIVLLDLTMIGSTESEVFAFGKHLEFSGIKTIVLTSHDNFKMRLAAVRANISAYMVKPAVITALVAEIRRILKLNLVKPFRVCMVDDQKPVIEYYTVAMEEYNIDIHGLTEPEQVLEFVQQFDPDIFIFDLFMPRISGIELAQLIRQNKKYDAIPIIFLSSDASLDLKLDILEVGCDDLLPKNMPADLLARQITARIIRGQTLRHLTNRDSMTGLLNHRQIIEAAQQALNLAIRTKRPLTVVMLDLDHFKKVNDTYGHAAGDKVIMGLAQLLLQSVRKSDYVSRYGGEEFLLVFQDAELEQVKNKVEQIRETFSGIKFLHDKQGFQVTASAGLACSTSSNDLTVMLGAADAALYEAKEKGRNCCVCAK